MGLTKCQKKALTALNNFIDSETESDFILSGNAGTGKTYLVADILMNDIHRDFEKIYILAKTNKALEVIQVKVCDAINNKSLVYGRDKKIIFKTIDSFLEKKQRDFDGIKGFYPEGYDIFVDPLNKEINYIALESKKITKLNADFEKLREDYFYYCNDIDERNLHTRSNTLIIIDEVSMLDKFEFGLIKRKIPNTKRLYLGDQLQLPAIDNNDKKSISYIFTINLPMINMITIKRTKIQSIGDIYQLTRDIVGIDNVKYTQIFKELKQRKLVYTEKYIKQQIIKDVEEENEFCVLSYSGEETNRYNGIISDCLETCKNKKLGYFIDTKYVSNIYYNKKIRNNTEFKITDVYKTRQEVMNDIVLDCFALKTNLQTTIYVVEEKDQEQFDVWFKDCKKILDLKGNNKVKNALIVDLNKLDLITKEYPTEEEKARMNFYAIRTKYTKREGKAFALCYSLSIYKSQGSSIKKCYVNLTDIFLSRYNMKERKKQLDKMKLKTKILYVATTRATESIIYF